MKKAILAVSITLGIGGFALIGCGDSGSGAGGNNGGTTSGQNCTSAHVCVNGVCNCGSDGKGASCTDDTKCESECQVCQ